MPRSVPISTGPSVSSGIFREAGTNGVKFSDIQLPLGLPARDGSVVLFLVDRFLSEALLGQKRFDLGDHLAIATEVVLMPEPIEVGGQGAKVICYAAAESRPAIIRAGDA